MQANWNEKCLTKTEYSYHAYTGRKVSQSDETSPLGKMFYLI